MFKDCISLRNIDLSNYNTKEVTIMSNMLNNWFSEINRCLKLEYIKAIYIDSMFRRCYTLNEIDLSYFNTQNLKNIKQMLYDYSNLMSIDISSFSSINLDYKLI